MCIHEHWSRMFAISNRYALSPASLMVFWNSGSCVLGVQLATTTLFRLCSFTICLIFSCVSCEQVYRFSSAYTTFGRDLAYSATDGTLTTPPMLIPQ